MTEAAHPTTPLRILILDDEATIRTTLTLCLEAAGHQVREFGTGGPALEAAGANVFDLLFLDLRLGIENGLDYIPRFLAQSPWLKIVVITAYASIDSAVEAMRRGATDYLPKPFTPEQVELVAAKVGEVRGLEKRVRELRDTLDTTMPPVSFLSASHAWQAAVQLARTLAPTKSAVLLQGESGTGKRTLARAMHDWSPRRDGPFAVFSALGRAEEGVAAELFGGSTANRSSAGPSRLEQCAGGTLYIDDLCVLPQGLQLKFLQLAQMGTFERESDYSPISADVRVITSTSKPLDHAVEAGVVRQDLYYTLSAKLIELPPLRERMEDFEALAELFVAFFGRQNGKAVTGFSREALEYLRSYAWPGNLRELRNVVERAVMLAGQASIGVQDLPANMRAKGSPAAVGDLVALDMIEELHIRGVIANTRSLETAAKVLGIDYATLWRRRRKYGL